jgi:hypothetical protein
MRILMFVTLSLAMDGSAFAQQACMVGGGDGAKVSEIFGPPAHDAGLRLQASDWSGARASIDLARSTVRTMLEHSVVAQFEMSLAYATGDVSHLDAAWAPLIASGCMTKAEIARHNRDVDAIRRR